MTDKLKAGDRRKLQGMISRTVRASAAFYEAQSKLNDWCSERYGAEPGDIDADQIIDSVFGGCGAASWMDAEEFHSIMVERTSQ